MPLLLPPDRGRNEPFTPTRRRRAPSPEGGHGTPIGRLRRPVPRSGRQSSALPHDGRTGPRPSGHGPARAPRPRRGGTRGRCPNSDAHQRAARPEASPPGESGGRQGAVRPRPKSALRQARGRRRRAFNGPAHPLCSAVTEFNESDVLIFVRGPRGPVFTVRVSALVEGVLPCVGFPSVNVVKAMSSPGEQACTQR